MYDAIPVSTPLHLVLNYIMYIGVQQANEAIKLGRTMSSRPSAMAELSLCDFDIALNSAILYFCVWGRWTNTHYAHIMQTSTN